MSFNPTGHYPDGFYPEGFFPEAVIIPQVTVPDVLGQSQASATTEIEGEGFVVAVITGYSGSVAIGNVASQDPAANTEANEGSTVTITVSLGPAPAVSRRARPVFGFGIGMG